jgi:hypothetical protein
LTKDAIYLRGLVGILDYLRDGGDLDILFVGKIAAEHVPIIRELHRRKVLRPPALRPRYLDRPEAIDTLRRVHGGMTVLDLLERKER